jgi:hypothetical protein
VIDWFTTAQIVVAVIVGVVCVILGLAGRAPNDYTLSALVIVELLLVGQIVVAAIAPAVGNSPTGDPLEFWIYLVSAALIPPAAVFWSLVERNRWSTAILGVAALAIAVMLYRMNQIWFVQGL